MASGSYNFFAEGDLLLAKVTPCFENGKKALAQGLSCGVGYATSEVHVIRTDTRRIDPRYLLYVLSSEDFRAVGMASMTGAGGLRRVSEHAILNHRVPVTDLFTQNAIAEFLDRETAHIDQLIAKKERQVELLHRRARQAVAELVTGAAVEGAATLQTRLDHIPRIPAHWSLQRAGHLFRQVTEPNTGDLPVLSVSIHRGISDRQLDDEERDRKVNLIEDRSSYKRVRPGYLAYNMMRAWQGAVGVSSVDGAVSPAYVVAKPTCDLHSPYYQFLLRTPPFIEQMRQGSKGITDFRLRLYWEQFRLIMLPVPPLEEQRRIAGEAEQELNHADEAADKVARSVELLKERRAALITAAVTGQIDIREKLPAVTTKPDRSKFRVIVGAEIVHRHQGNPKFGRVKLQKELYLAEAHLGIDGLQGNYLREAAGPLDRALIDETERGLEAAGFYRASQRDGTGTAVTYAPLAKAGQHKAELETLLGSKANELRKLITALRDLDRREVEAVATLYAVWNDALMDGEEPDDTAVINGVLTEWHTEKGEKFKADDLSRWLGWMKRQGLTPRGQGPRTAHTTTRDMFG
ncbi:restriction endonuclease subunit S [Nitratireductor thuwali]|uniref:restriction endonuclease subunit S n=1 Tax=Nitratireductor thuwali TaxID=2267699 RepID=UPI0030D09DF1